MNEDNLLFFKTLFRPGEYSCFGSLYSSNVSEVPLEEYLNSENVRSRGYHEFYCINPLNGEQDFGYLAKPDRDEYTPRRADINVTAYRNFVFEIDSTDLESQMKLLKASKLPWSAIVYSGGKSYHAVLALENALEASYHTVEGVTLYKKIWKRIAAFLDELGHSMKLPLVKDAVNFVDPTSQNPSRLTRFPNFRRDTGKFQKIVHLGDRVSNEEFFNILNNCPEIQESVIVNTECEDPSDTALEFWKKAPVGLKNKLRYPDWAGSVNMYPKLYAYTLWAIDSTFIPKEAFIEVLSHRVFPALLENGYPEHKLMVAINCAYNEKKRKLNNG